MKISELTTEQATDFLCELTPFISNIVSDDELLEEIKKTINIKDVKSKAELIVIGAEKVSKITPILLKKRKSDVFNILGLLNNKTADEIASQNIIKTLIQIKEIIKDKELIDFFKSCAE